MSAGWVVAGAASLLGGPAALAAPVREHVVGGAAATADYPFQAQVLVSRGSSTVLCGGTLVADRWVLTAAHCISDERTGAVAAPTAVRVRLGSRRLLAGTAHAVDRVDRSPDWSAADLRSDAALLHLSDTAVEAPLALADGDASARFAGAGAPARVIGFGQTSEHSAASSVLQEADVPLVADGDCRAAYGGEFDVASMLCAGGAGVDACYGDSGGPLLVDADPSPAVAWRQVGIVSWGRACAAPGYPGVYADLQDPRLRAWIDAELSGVPLAPDAAAAAAATVPVTAAPTVAVQAPAVEPATIALPRSCAAGICRVRVRFDAAGIVTARLTASGAVARRLAAAATAGARRRAGADARRALARAALTAPRAGRWALRLTLPATLRRAMRDAGVRRVAVRLRVDASTAGAARVLASRVVRVAG